jgi:hypothetical protein
VYKADTHTGCSHVLPHNACGGVISFSNPGATNPLVWSICEENPGGRGSHRIPLTGVFATDRNAQPNEHPTIEATMAYYGDDSSVRYRYPNAAAHGKFKPTVYMTAPPLKEQCALKTVMIDTALVRKPS